MRPHFQFLAAFVIAISGASCSHRENSGVSLNLTVDNASTTAYWVDLDWAGVVVGILPPGISATSLDVEPPTTNIITLEMMVDTNRQHKASIQKDVAYLRQLSSGRHDVTISIVSETEVKLVVDGHEK